MSGGTVDGILESGGHTYISGGTVENVLWNQGFSNVSGGTVEGIYNNGGMVNISGGAITPYGNYDIPVICNNGGTVIISGGTFTGAPASNRDIWANGGTVYILGTDFNYGYGRISSPSGTLTGTLADGSLLDLSFAYANGGIAADGDIVLLPPGAIPPNSTVPEPSTLVVWSLLGASGAAIGWWRRKRKAA